MGKALYRTHRSRSFDEVVGQEHITTTLKNAIRKGVISHAYLFTGPRGVGKTSIARILAHEINNLPYSDESIHLDIIEIDAASNRRIDEIRDLRDKVHIAPTSAKYKVYIIDEVHMLTREAFNALLKTLEEPPEHVVFILATTEAHKVPETIVSRTQQFRFRAIEQDAAVDHLRAIAKKEKLNIDDTALALLARHGRGSFRDSISMLDQLAGLSAEHITEEDVRLLLGIPPTELIEALIEAIASDSTKDLFAAVSDLQDQGVDSGQVARTVSEHLREQLLGTSRLSEQSIVSILHALLPLTKSTNDWMQLELALLQGRTLKPATSKKPQQRSDTQPTAAEPKSAKETEEAPKQSIPKPQTDRTPTKTIEPADETPEQSTKKTIPQTAFDEESWQQLLELIKKERNTLYGILRMSKATLDDGALTLHFRFPFHKKQIDSAKNSSILKEYIAEAFGVQTVKTTLVIEEKSQTDEPAPTPSPQKTETVDIISSVSDIFGGAELLES